MTDVRVRIAPSPTGDPHVGTAYIALFNAAFAKKHNGKFILRIEDTDQARSTPESEQAILRSLNWLGLRWDEGPDVGGEYGPYRQSERGNIYKKYADELVEKGHAFHCFCTSERLDELRKKQMEEGSNVTGYDGLCSHLSPEEVQQRLSAGESHVVRMKIPTEGQSEFTDLLRGDIAIDWAQVDMQILLKSDGMPSYHLANVVDDHLMKVTHVMRGEEWISSTPKHVLLYQYFGWQAPVFCHFPLLRNADKSKLSKRKNPTSIDYYRRMGILPEALLNYLGMMGWSMPNGEEKFDFAAMVENFDISRMSLGGPVFDQEKLSWLNGRYIRENHTPEQLAKVLGEWAYNPEYFMQFMPLVQERIEKLSDVAPLVAFFFSGLPAITPESFASIKLEPEMLQKTLQFLLWKLESERHWNKDSIMADVKHIAAALDLKMRDVMAPIFVSITGSTASVSVLDAMEIIGPDLTRARLRHALVVTGLPSKKGLKKLEKEYQQIDSFMD
ncbi:glutamate--tRNA ligase [Gynuella sunshinyii]|uniref:Glutamate--tRNA ligase n=1 Tax=Gynuella sunshinyii YC6258 TaxID=1445510 RepID=A0A0C5VX28_9GAMM|nr:glutamate--tRNA ligase [Gynuella sunshinyii]AJQ95004.1 glutamyl- and glutaminyl-tRNA synthetase [Gynuella sunshinyii YC6258]